MQNDIKQPKELQTNTKYYIQKDKDSINTET